MLRRRAQRVNICQSVRSTITNREIGSRTDLEPEYDRSRRRGRAHAPSQKARMARAIQGPSATPHISRWECMDSRG